MQLLSNVENERVKWVKRGMSVCAASGYRIEGPQIYSQKILLDRHFRLRNTKWYDPNSLQVSEL